MSTPTSFRFPFDLQGEKPEVQQAHRYAFNGIKDLNDAVASLKTQLTAVSTASTSSTSTTTTENVTENVTEVTETLGGAVNNQTGVTAYATQQSDFGALILLADASPVALTLSVTASLPGITIPFFCFAFNNGTGLVTATPVTGTISYGTTVGASSMPLVAGSFVTIFFDGTNFYATALPLFPANTPAVTHEWLNSYNSTTGVFTQTQPAFSDVSGSLTTAQLPTAGLSVTITTAKLTTGGTNGSQTFTNGVLTAQVAAT